MATTFIMDAINLAPKRSFSRQRHASKHNES